VLTAELVVSIAFVPDDIDTGPGGRRVVALPSGTLTRTATFRLRPPR
jgi:hypothetical protein